MTVPQYWNIWVPLNDGIELEPWTDGEWKAELGGDVNIELVLLFSAKYLI